MAIPARYGLGKGEGGATDRLDFEKPLTSCMMFSSCKFSLEFDMMIGAQRCLRFRVLKARICGVHRACPKVLNLSLFAARASKIREIFASVVCLCCSRGRPSTGKERTRR